MPDYKTMYAELFRAMTQAIDILQTAQRITEEMYISAEEPIIRVLPLQDRENENESDDHT